MASPYILIGAYPQLLRFLPRPGAWMETFKQLMGFVLLGTVVWLLTSIPWAYIVPCVAMMMVLWAACWWIGRTPLTADLGAKLRAWGWAAAFSGAMSLFCFVWLADAMEHRFQRTLDTEFAQRDDASGALAGGDRDWNLFLQDRQQKLQATPKNALPWQAFSNKRLKMLTDNGYTVLVDFTAQWCPTCKVNEAVAFNTADTRASLDAHGVVPLVADMTEDSPAAKELLEQLGNHATSIPYCAIFPAGQADKPIILDGPLLKQHVIAALEQAGPSKNAINSRATAMNVR
jgi:thiol:disulfide interchange protein